MSVPDTGAWLCPLRMKRESGANPGQSRCCDVHIPPCAERFRQDHATAAISGREGVGTGTSQKTCRRRKIATCEGQDRSDTAATASSRETDAALRLAEHVSAGHSHSSCASRNPIARNNLTLIIIKMKTTIKGASYHAPSIREIGISLESGFATSAFSGTTGNENYGYENENWD